jgi:hypothetical protein
VEDEEAEAADSVCSCRRRRSSGRRRRRSMAMPGSPPGKSGSASRGVGLRDRGTGWLEVVGRNLPECSRRGFVSQLGFALPPVHERTKRHVAIRLHVTFTYSRSRRSFFGPYSFNGPVEINRGEQSSSQPSQI